MSATNVKVSVSATVGKIMSVIGYILGAVSLLFIIFCLMDLGSRGAKETLVFFLFVLAFCGFLIRKGSQIKQRIKRFKQYIALISTEQITSLENIATRTSQSMDFVKNDLQMMIDKNYFANAAIDMRTHAVIIGNSPVSAPSSTSASKQVQTAAQLEKFTCSGCGASGMKPKGEAVSCEYCGSPIQ